MAELECKLHDAVRAARERLHAGVSAAAIAPSLPPAKPTLERKRQH